ncbi:MAG: sigma-54 dependent transcriptional regulator, partial [Myxococcota bacterium]|nr:sigma-54 dependent transcriptional regulator [Myxococcota bacterium]
GALEENLLNSELFGHEKGAFTGAVERRIGRFELAHTGTLFLDEIGDMRLDVQAKLLRALQEGEIERVGGSRTIAVDVRIVAATNKDLATEIAEKGFRDDLYYRLNVVPIHAPPLRERKSDLPLLARSFVARAATEHGVRSKQLLDQALDALVEHDWPGNVRELRNAVERAVVIAYDETITVDELPEPVRELAAPGEPAVAIPAPRTSGDASVAAVNLKEKLGQVEADLIIAALGGAGWNREEAARTLGVSLRTLARRIAAHGIRRVSYGRDGGGEPE